MQIENIKGADILNMLCPNVEYLIRNNDYDTIDWFGKPAAITKAQFEAGFAQYESWKAEQEEAQATAKAAAEAKLAALGLTADDLKALGL
jgi:hypothetical protein